MWMLSDMSIIHYSLDNKAYMHGWGGWSYLVEMPIVMESVQKNHSTPQQPVLQGVWRGSTPESDLQWLQCL